VWSSCEGPVRLVKGWALLRLTPRSTHTRFIEPAE
jgi:hypothetical protein